jgi:hypothetical protein
MARDYLAFRDIEGKLEWLNVECTKCPRKGRYSVANLIETYGRDGNMQTWRRSLTEGCARREAWHVYEGCDTVMPDLPKVL